MPTDVNALLLTGAALSALAAMLHLAVIAGGPSWYRVFGAGPRMVRLAERRSIVPPLVTVGIAAVLGAWAAYAASGAGLLPRLPLTRAVLSAITSVYIARGLILVPAALVPRLRTPFNLWSSAVCLAIGLVHAVGLWQVWTRF